MISESGMTDRNGDNAVAGPVGNMRQLAEYLSGHGVASLRYDKVGTGATGLGPFADRPADVGSAVLTSGARAAVRFLAGQSRTDAGRISVYGLGEGTTHAMALATDSTAGAPKIHALGLLQPLTGRYLDLITARVERDTAAAVKATIDRLKPTLPEGIDVVYPFDTTPFVQVSIDGDSSPTSALRVMPQ